MVLPGCIIGAIVMKVAWAHNAQGEFHEFGYDASILEGLRHPTQVNWFYWFAIGVSWFIPTTVVVGLVAFVVSIFTHGSDPTKRP